MANPKNKETREALCLATDLGGYSIMVGKTVTHTGVSRCQESTAEDENAKHAGTADR